MDELHIVTKVFGLNKIESEIFEYLVQFGTVKSADLRRVLHLDRAPLYRAVNDLVMKDLVVVTGSLRNQSVELQNIQAIKAKIISKKQEIESAEQSIESLQASMQELRDSRFNRDNIEIFSGKDAYIRSVKSILAGGGKIMRDLNPGHSGLHALAGGEDKYHEIVTEIKAERIRKNISIRILMDNQAKGIAAIPIPPKTDLKEYRIFPSNLHMQCYLNVCGSRVLFYTTDVGGSWGLVLKDQFVAKLIESLFDVLWNQSNPI